MTLLTCLNRALDSDEQKIGWLLLVKRYNPNPPGFILSGRTHLNDRASARKVENRGESKPRRIPIG